MSHDTPTNPPSPGPAEGTEAERLLEVGLSTPTSGGRTPPAPESLAEQFPDFEVLEVLGQGGMGVVYKARQRKLDRLVALKVLPRELSEDPAFAERFAREGRALARLQHTHIVGVHDIGEADGQYYLVMEYVDGVNLRALMEAGELTAKEALTIVPQICDALQYAHDQGVVHRDIKPENVLLDRAGAVKVADFGLAKMVERAPGDFTLTGTDQVMGTLHYMAPEQYKTPQDVDHRADIFSLGVVFYEMLTGELPVGRFDQPSKTGDLDARIDQIVMRTLEREREQRYQHARDVSTAVHGFATEAPRAADGVLPPLRRAVGEVEQAARSLWDKPSRAGHDSYLTEPSAGAGRRWSRWAVAALIFLLVTPVLGGAAYGLVGAFAEHPKAHMYDGVAGWIVTLVGLGVTGLLSVVAVIVTQICRADVRGQWLAVSLCVLTLVGVVIGFLCLDGEVRDLVYWTRYYKENESGIPRPHAPDATQARPPVVVLGVGSREGVAVREAIDETLDAFTAVVSYSGVDHDELVLRRLYAPDDLERLQQLGGDEDDEKRAAGAYGLGMWARHVALHQWRDYALRRVQVDASGERARVHMVHHPIAGGAGGAFLGRGMGRPPESFSFPMRRTPDGWVFAIGPVRIP